jgi:hypothetical protein
MDTPIHPVYRADYEQAVTVARTELDEETFASIWAAGRAMTLEQIVNEALKRDSGAGKL